MSPADRQIHEFIDIAKQMPPPVAPKLITNLDDVRYMHCLCGKRKLCVDMPPRHSGIVAFKDIICRGCVKGVQKWATVVCRRCSQVVLKREPGRDKDGFTFLPGGIYHTLNCASCCPELESTEIIERLLYRRNNNLSTS